MGRNNNFLLGNGERLTEDVRIKKSGGDKKPPYEWQEAKEQVKSWLFQTIEDFNKIPSEASPEGEVSAVITMHPRYTSKSDFPKQLLDSVGVRAVGGRSRKIKPKSWGIEKHPEEAITDEIIVVGTRQNFNNWATNLNAWADNFKGSLDLTHLEEIKAFNVEDKIKSTEKNSSSLYEFVIHEGNKTKILSSFTIFAEKYNAKVISEKTKLVGNLAFVPVYTDALNAEKLAQFTYVRVLRSMPHLRTLMPNTQRMIAKRDTNLSTHGEINPSLRVVVFDGGIPKNSPILKWVNLIEPNGIGEEDNQFLEHGLGVTSALLFGSLKPDDNTSIHQMCKVDHVRVLDKQTGINGDFELYDVLDRILEILDNAKQNNKPYDFVNLSIGPDIPIEDDEINSWTASLDQRFVGNESVVTVAAGNSGESDAELRLNRIQPPSDAVNVITVGSCDTDEFKWDRASYSSVGPGRCPGIIKPDGVVFGGSSKKKFMVLSPGDKPTMFGIDGTSFAAPSLLRSTIAVRGRIGPELSSLANRALFVHRAERDPKLHSIEEVGWGRFQTNPDNLITCEDDEAVVIFQGELPVGQHLRAPIPMPEGELEGMVTVTSTLVISPEIDPSYPNTYTRAGLEITFRPNSEKRKLYDNGSFSEHPETSSFFNRKGIFGESELDLREDGHKWETCLKATRRFRATTLIKPLFDIYYHHREEGQSLKKPKPIPYALVVSMKAPKVQDFYNRVLRTYSNVLVPLRPRTNIQING
ncbi:S8 family peptidase [Bacillus altitudinis]|uniref:S8 family peptidase n=1 Tax=Bacillus altitudinis TaxID=293387 RepID=UPI0022828B71|nr:S8 family peptidase [Bacillus altitudinis]MCY7451654.1 S8 family peptidase [Bacillus altitudinis]MCY7695766.1 S8 family peptidase [Bacillus altitudinis]